MQSSLILLGPGRSLCPIHLDGNLRNAELLGQLLLGAQLGVGVAQKWLFQDPQLHHAVSGAMPLGLLTCGHRGGCIRTVAVTQNPYLSLPTPGGKLRGHKVSKSETLYSACPSTDGWEKKQGVYATEYYSAMKKD